MLISNKDGGKKWKIFEWRLKQGEITTQISGERGSWSRTVWGKTIRVACSRNNKDITVVEWASQVAQWQRIHLLMQETQETQMQSPCWDKLFPSPFHLYFYQHSSGSHLFFVELVKYASNWHWKLPNLAENLGQLKPYIWIRNLVIYSNWPICFIWSFLLWSQNKILCKYLSSF